ncbi:porin family protein [Botryobacter ruber]|uniref:hypothetical protein n=1 Tax=Botryobacter ruber TaxID=2171629 RepID=UPI000E0C8BB4|nr:hypothetical protein [Botryobacter ruber]
MSTNNISDEELDNLFRKSAESYDPPYDPEAWKAMEQKLDSVDGKHSWWHKLFYPLLLLLGIYSIVAVVKLAQQTEMKTKAVSENRIPESRQQVSNTPGIIPQQPLQERPKVPVEVHTIKKTAASNPVTGQSTAGASKPHKVSAAKRQIFQDKILLVTGREKQDKKRADAEPVAEAAQDTGNSMVNSPVLGNKVQDSIAVSKFDDGARSALLPSAATQATPDTAQAAAPVAEQSVEADSSSLNSKTNRRSPFLSSLQVALLVAPDFTTVKLRNPEAISANAGIAVGVPVTNRISILTGVVWANKVYGARPEDYTPSDDYWSGRKLPTSIDGVCKVLDIPLNVSYRVLEWGKNSFAVQAGLSSYIMLNEKYTYNYDYSYGSYKKTVEIANQNKHWFGVQNLSVSYSRKLSPVFSVGVEPFVKIPLTGIGAGHIKLTSAGIFLTAGYTVSRKK